MRLYKCKVKLISVRRGPFKKKCNGLTRTQKSLSRPDFRLRFKTQILTLEIVTCKLLLLERPTLSQFFRFRFVYGIFFCMKVDHHSYRRNVCSYEKKAWKKFRLVWVSKVAPITAMITAIIFCHIILHPAVHIYNFHIFIMLWRANVNNKLLEFSSHAMFVLELSIVT